MKKSKSTESKVRIFQSALNGITYKYEKPLPATIENLRKVATGEL